MSSQGKNTRARGSIRPGSAVVQDRADVSIRVINPLPGRFFVNSCVGGSHKVVAKVTCAVGIIRPLFANIVLIIVKRVRPINIR